MKKSRKKYIPEIIFIVAFILIIVGGIYIYLMPFKEAEHRNAYEDTVIEEYLENEEQEETKIKDNPKTEYQYSDVNTYNFRGSVDSILVIDKINLKKAVIRGNKLSDKDYNLSKYYFVTEDLETTLAGNYIIYGHSSQTYGHSFNRLDELEISDEFYLIQGDSQYVYKVEAVDRALRSESEPFFPNLENRVTLVSCEKHLAKGYSQKRVIIVRAVLIEEKSF